MKKFIGVFVAIAITAGAYAQAGSTNGSTTPQELKTKQNQNMQNNPVGKSHADGVMMQNGKMMQVKNGQLTSLDQDLTLTNGTKVKSDGTCVKKDGTKMTLKEGQHLDMSGKVTNMSTNKDDNMYLVPDSTKKKTY
jgi:hypothetical protein